MRAITLHQACSMALAKCHTVVGTKCFVSPQIIAHFSILARKMTSASKVHANTWLTRQTPLPGPSIQHPSPAMQRPFAIFRRTRIPWQAKTIFTSGYQAGPAKHTMSQALSSPHPPDSARPRTAARLVLSLADISRKVSIKERHPTVFSDRCAEISATMRGPPREKSARLR